MNSDRKAAQKNLRTHRMVDGLCSALEMARDTRRSCIYDKRNTFPRLWMYSIVKSVDKAFEWAFVVFAHL